MPEMPLTSNLEETIRLEGTCADWLTKCVQALEKGRFSRICADPESLIIDADYRGMTVDGSIRLSLTPERDQAVIEIHIIAAVDNVCAFFSPPLERILRAFKSRLPIRHAKL
jgi:hypothetical protein